MCFSTGVLRQDWPILLLLLLFADLGLEADHLIWMLVSTLVKQNIENYLFVGY